jgi:hypothetical protein
VELIVVPRFALAQESRQEEVLPLRHKMYESPQHFAAEIRFGPYYPDIDSDPALHSAQATACSQGGGPAAATFGTSDRLMFSAEFDWQALRIPHLGTLGPAVSVGYTSLSGNATFLTPHVTASGSTCTSGESTTLEIFPIFVLGVLRADVLWRELRIPLVPYLKAGLGNALWRASNSLGTSNANGVSGEGHTYGTQLAAGIALNLNIFDEYAARNFDDQVGVNNTYVFFEYTWSTFQGLGLQTDPLRVGDSTWVAGLAWEF